MAAFVGPFRRQNLRKLLGNFLLTKPEENQDKAPTVLDLDTLERFLIAEPQRIRRQSYVEAFENNRDIFKSIRDACGNLGELPDELLQAGFYGLLLLGSREQLSFLLGSLTDPTQTPQLRKEIVEDDLLPAIQSIPTLSKICHNLQDPDVIPVAKPNRSDDPKHKALKRDGEVCVITRTPNPEVAHIWPYAAMGKRSSTTSCLGVLAPYLGDYAQNLVEKIGEEGEKIDHVSNMLCLSPTMHDWMSRGYFILEPLSPPVSRPAPPRESTTRQSSRHQRVEWYIQLRFEWLEKTSIPHMKSPISFDTTIRALVIDPHKAPLRAFNANTSRPIDTGDMIEITADRFEDLPDFDILKLVTDLTRIRSIVGAAEPPPETPTASSSSSEGVRNIVEGLESISIGNQPEEKEKSGSPPLRRFRNLVSSVPTRRQQQRSSSSGTSSQGFRRRLGNIAQGSVRLVRTISRRALRSDDDAPSGEEGQPDRPEPRPTTPPTAVPETAPQISSEFMEGLPRIGFSESYGSLVEGRGSIRSHQSIESH
ncbi:hypothetical protein CH063_01129 [Colletotrichum higginsianum]|uniref:Integral membrane protein n=1 Tax=Colletotrichum higginsianum (strain IMI 349063) TaxID=759273 RepID=H1V2D5_COLHI|nr:Integral membrane protein [Colletotrichum higginsianum IMI 349063]OBR03816.1 Integral membrane protein [Colletotrichum higginsianum IMI 349063]CCF34387.1 hypothetical protein CH063_01129 [Colletotrichum higginsianum]